MQVAPFTEGKVPLAITKENKRIKKELVENNLDVVSVIDYFNDKANKQFKAYSKATMCLRERHTVVDCKKSN